MTYAAGTSVTASKTRVEIEEYLARRGCISYAAGFDGGSAVIAFATKERHVRIRMPLPAPESFRKKKDGYWERTDAQVAQLHEQACRERWRCLLLTLKAKWTSIETGVETFDEAFLSHLVIPGGGTVGQKFLPAIAEAYNSGKAIPPLLGAG